MTLILKSAQARCELAKSIIFQHLIRISITQESFQAEAICQDSNIEGQLSYSEIQQVLIQLAAGAESAYEIHSEEPNPQKILKIERVIIFIDFDCVFLIV